VHFNRIAGFYVNNQTKELTMSIEDRNQERNNAVTQRLTQLQACIESHEERFRQMRIFCEVRFKYDHWEEIENGSPVGEHQQLIGLVRINGKWRLCHANHYFDFSDDFPVDWKPLVDVAIVDRIRAIEHIEALREELIRSKEALLPEIEQAIAKLAAGLK
jgi:hypothetical protein